MSRLATGLVFFALLMTVMGGLHYLIWARLVRDTALPPPWGRTSTVAVVALGLSMPLTFLLVRLFGLRTVQLFAWPAYLWMGLLVFVGSGLFTVEAVRLVALRLFREAVGAEDPERRLFLSRLAGGLVAGSSGVLGALALREGLRDPALKEVDVELARLPASADGMSIVQMSDVHVGPTIGREFITRLVDRANALEPDIVVITGDLVDGSVERLGDAVAPLGQLRAKHGVYFVTGNHEYYSGAREWVDFLSSIGLRVLRNEHVQLPNGVDLAGIDDHSGRSMLPDHGADLPRALSGRDPGRPVVLLSHQPRGALDAARHAVDLVLSGHTHGGQIWPWALLVKLQQPFLAGLCEVSPSTRLYVSCGTGYWGPPMRLGAPSELTRLVLRTPRSPRSA